MSQYDSFVIDEYNHLESVIGGGVGTDGVTKGSVMKFDKDKGKIFAAGCVAVGTASGFTVGALKSNAEVGSTLGGGAIGMGIGTVVGGAGYAIGKGLPKLLK